MKRTWPALPAAVAVLLLAALLRFVNLGQASLWLDELYNLTVLPGATLSRLAAPVDQHPPLYYLLLHYWLRLGQGELWMRFPSALAGLLAVALMWRAAARLGPHPTGLLAAALLAFSPLHVWYTREARMYGLASLAWVASLYGFVVLLRWGRWRDVFVFAAGALAGLFLTYSSFALWLVLTAVAVLAWPRLAPSVRRRWLLGQAIVVLGFAIWWPGLSRQLENPLIFNWDLPLWPTSAVWHLSFTLSQLVQIGAVMTLLALAATVAASRALSARPAMAARLSGLVRPAAWVIIAALAISLVVGAIPLGLSIRRQLLVFWPVVVLLAAWALVWLRQRALAGGLLALGLVLSTVMILAPPYEDWRGVTSLLAERTQADDRIILNASYAAHAFDYYYDGAATYAGVNPVDLPVTPKLTPGQQAWLVLVNVRQADPKGQVAAWVEGQARLVSTYSFGRITVREYIAR